MQPATQRPSLQCDISAEAQVQSAFVSHAVEPKSDSKVQADSAQQTSAQQTSAQQKSERLECKRQSRPPDAKRPLALRRPSTTGIPSERRGACVRIAKRQPIDNPLINPGFCHAPEVRG